MKRKYIELDVDFVGGQESLTKEEEKAISDFIISCKSLVTNDFKKRVERVNSQKKKMSQSIDIP
ncbi:MAG: hypothetical protein LBQ65_06375 [Tannerellaceae bacterium]|jgi:hypothetical protein|nr:hypothetical protein [Tannerellaceae bacterium]